MYTSLLCLSLACSADAKAVSPKALTWQTDYSAAQKRAIEEKKPLAVVIGNGPSGWQSLAKDGKFDKAVVEALQDHYVYVYVDAKTERGQKLADAFEMKKGIVLSDRSGDSQAFRHEGTLSSGDLDTVLHRYANPDYVVTRTETNEETVIRNYPAAAPAAQQYQFNAPYSGGYCPSCQGR